MGLLGLLNLSCSQSFWPHHSACGGGHYHSALGLEMTSEILISLPEVFQTFAPQRGGGAGTDSSSATFILISAEFLLPEDIFDFRFAETFPALACIVLKF